MNNYKSAVGIVYYHNKWLLGLAEKSKDDRENRWCFPGGGIENGESPEEAAIREVREETGVTCKAMSRAFKHDKESVAFVLCKATSDTIKTSKEFPIVSFFTTRQMKSLKLYPNVIDLINKVR